MMDDGVGLLLEFPGGFRKAGFLWNLMDASGSSDQSVPTIPYLCLPYGY